MTDTTFNLVAATVNINNAIYQFTRNSATPLTPENCVGELTLGGDGKKLHFETNDIAPVVAPLMFAKVKIEDFGARMYDEPQENGAVADVRLSFRFDQFMLGSNGTNFADITLDKDGNIVDIAFAEDKHKAFIADNPRFA